MMILENPVVLAQSVTSPSVSVEGGTRSWREARKMTDEEIRAGILEAAYKAARGAASIKAGIFNIYEISKDWGEEKKKIEFNAEYLNEKDLVIWAESGGGMRITAAGVEEYERAHEGQ